jgi:hypothetical protein
MILIKHKICSGTFNEIYFGYTDVANTDECNPGSVCNGICKDPRPSIESQLFKRVNADQPYIKEFGLSAKKQVISTPVHNGAIIGESPDKYRLDQSLAQILFILALFEKKISTNKSDRLHYILKETSRQVDYAPSSSFLDDVDYHLSWSYVEEAQIVVEGLLCILKGYEHKESIQLEDWLKTFRPSKNNSLKEFIGLAKQLSFILEELAEKKTGIIYSGYCAEALDDASIDDEDVFTLDTNEDAIDDDDDDDDDDIFTLDMSVGAGGGGEAEAGHVVTINTSFSARISIGRNL